MKNKKMRRYIRIFLLVVVILCLGQIGREYRLSVKHRAQQTELIEKQETAGTDVENETFMVEMADDTGMDRKMDYGRDGGQTVTDDTVKSPAGKLPAKEEILEKYAGLYEENGDFAGWLRVEGTKIDYPVMQNEDDEYYLHRDFYGQESKYGCLYVRERADLDAGTNFIIYGHNMKDGSMFGELDLYADPDFWREHPTMAFDTLTEERTYEVIAVFRSQVYAEEEDVFKYYQFYEADTEDEFDDFYENIKELSLYDTGVEAEFGDRFMTLSTCAYHVEDGRFVVVAKLQEPEL